MFIICKNHLTERYGRKILFNWRNDYGRFLSDVIHYSKIKRTIITSLIHKKQLIHCIRRVDVLAKCGFSIHCATVVFGDISFVLWKFNDRKKILAAIILLTITDLVIATQLNAPYTVYYDTVTAKEAAENVSKYPKGFPKLQDISIEQAGHLPLIGTPFWQNMNTFQKQISAEGYNSFSFTSYEFLESEYPQLFSEVKKNKLLLLSDSILPESKLKVYKKDSLFSQIRFSQ